MAPREKETAREDTYIVEFRDDRKNVIVTSGMGEVVPMENLINALKNFKERKSRDGQKDYPLIVKMGEKIRFDPLALSEAGREFLPEISFYDLYDIVDFEAMDYIDKQTFREAVISAKSSTKTS